MVEKTETKKGAGRAAVQQRSETRRIRDERIEVQVSSVPIDLYLSNKHLLVERMGKSYFVMEDGVGGASKKRGYIELEEGKGVPIGSRVKEATDNLDLEGFDLSPIHLKITLKKDVFVFEDTSTGGTTVLYTP